MSKRQRVLFPLVLVTCDSYPKHERRRGLALVLEQAGVSWGPLHTPKGKMHRKENTSKTLGHREGSEPEGIMGGLLSFCGPISSASREPLQSEPGE